MCGLKFLEEIKHGRGLLIHGRDVAPAEEQRRVQTTTTTRDPSQSSAACRSAGPSRRAAALPPQLVLASVGVRVTLK